ncbi:hypothetical protein GALMADRAFT_154856 [Galerina marginata CBS 339.88]|uniref:Arrestin-like N-terminal domain-containing protein n=1 Tax=Galerina marginata (strain CBS 339.88) TaxID=685588 RepID=A0A067T739_GALM3|nr:hypothetical protein GALMADRAFT_154856 [Galerina marginata CBS 339.88]
MSTPVRPPVPPSYSGPTSGVLATDGTHLDTETSNVADLPLYTPGRRSVSRATSREEPQMKEFLYDTKNRKGKAVAVLNVIAERSYSKHIPTFLQDTPIKGSVSLSLDKPDTIQSVVLLIQGQFLTGASPDQQLNFLNLTCSLWSPSSGEPRNDLAANDSSAPPINNSSRAVGAATRFTGKLHGEYSWPFSIPLPKEVVLPSGKEKEQKSFTLPQTFNERHARGSINYEMSVRISRGKLQSDYRIFARFGYIPISRPPPLPNLRRLSYQEGTLLLGPTIDPEGWYSEDSVTIQGSVFNNRTVQIGCTLCLAKPLCYTRGSLIPLFLRLESDDQQSLDLLSAPKAISVALKRRIRYHFNPSKALGMYHLRDTIDYSQPAVWWPSTEGSEEPLGRFRFLNGELHLQPDMKPTSAMGDFRMEYNVVFFPFDTTGFEPSDNGALLEYPIDIVTSFAHGPRPRKFAPPGYESEARPPRDFLLN